MESKAGCCWVLNSKLLIKGLLAMAVVLLFITVAKTSSAVQCNVVLNQGQCICHNIGGGSGEICPSASGQVNGHDSHLAEWCCVHFPGGAGSPPTFCNFATNPANAGPFLDCSCTNASTQDTFGKCNGCGNGVVENKAGCCNPNISTCTDLNNICENCDDGNNVSGDGCSANCQKECTGGCNDNNTCTTDSCDPQTGLCKNVPAPGDTCDDNNLCTTNDSCQNDGTCSGDSVTCSASDNCHIAGTCNPADGECSNPNKPDGSTCADNDHCNGDETCENGVCQPGTPVDCDDGKDCTADSCDANGDCQHDPVNVACHDDSSCTVGDACDADGNCVGTPKNCDDNNACTDDTCDANKCDPLSSECDPCVHAPNSTGEVDCYTGPEGTKDVGVCHGGHKMCVDGELGDECVGEVTPSDEICDGLDNDCDGVVDNGGNSLCSDDDLCNGIEICGGEKGCSAGTPVVVPPDTACQTFTCDSATGKIVTHNKPAGTSCGDTSSGECDNPDSCDGAGACVPNHKAPGTNCGDADSACVNQDTCDASGSCHDNGFKSAETACGDPSSGECDNPDHCSGSSADCLPNHKDPGTNCGDAEGPCVNQDTCNADGICHDNGFKSSDTACGDSSSGSCDNPDHCSGSSADCLPDHKDDGTSCADENLCNGAETCKAGVCSAGTPVNCDDGDPCTSDSCDKDGQCHHDFTQGEGCECNDVKDCKAPADPQCASVACEGHQCVTHNSDSGTSCGSDSSGSCDNPDTCDGKGTCQANHKDDGTSCADENLCNGDETCKAGVCAAGTAVNCDDGDPCTADSCDKDGQCHHDFTQGEGCECNDVKDCKAPADPQCASVACEGHQCVTHNSDSGTSCGSDSSGACDNPDSCDGKGTCQANHKDDGTSCADENLCNGDESCKAGVCSAGTAVNCDDGDPCTADTCDKDGQCHHDFTQGEGCECNDVKDCAAPANPQCASVACEGHQCVTTNSEAGTSCGDDSSSACDNPDTCDGHGACQPNPKEDGTSCADGNSCNGDEVCEDGACQPGKPVTCGDGQLDPDCGETCDNGLNNSDITPDACRSNCQPAHCGDGLKDSNEQCDGADADACNGQGCNADCNCNAQVGEQGGVTPFCGNGIVEQGEQCDEGANNSNFATCSKNCKNTNLALEGSGNGGGNNTTAIGCSMDTSSESSNRNAFAVGLTLALPMIFAVSLRKRSKLCVRK